MNAPEERLEALFSISTEISSTLQLEEVLAARRGPCVSFNDCPRGLTPPHR